MKTYKDFIKETDENGVLEYWIERPFFKPSDFKEAIEENYTHNLKRVTKNELSIENEIEFIKEELTDLQGLIKAKPSYDYEKLSFAQRISGDCWFSDETLNEFKRYFKEYYNYKIKGFKADYLKSKLEDLQKPDALLENPDEKIFSDDFAYTLFDKMKGFYSDTKTPQADYSFLFDIMQKDGFFICTGVKFITFLSSQFDINLTKIDSSKTGSQPKTKLYNVTKENLQKKHGLSTKPSR